MTQLTLLDKLYGPAEKEATKEFNNLLTSTISGIDAQIKITGKTSRNWIKVDVSGSDSTVLTNFLLQRSGIAPHTLGNLTVSAELKGRIIDSGNVGYGLYVDVGVSQPETIDALIPLHVLRRQLAEDKKVSIPKIIEAFCLYDNLPLKIKITKITPEKKLEAELAQEQISTIQNWLSSNLDRVIVLGASSDIITYVIKASNITRDIVKVEYLGFLEHTLLCKLGTEAPGIIHKLGKYLPRIPMYAFSKNKAQTLLEI
jgi:hypothetical protein